MLLKVSMKNAKNWHTICARWCNDYNLDNLVWFGLVRSGLVWSGRVGLMSLLMYHKAYMPVYMWSRFFLHWAGGSTRGSTRDPCGPKNSTHTSPLSDHLFPLWWKPERGQHHILKKSSGGEQISQTTLNENLHVKDFSSYSDSNEWMSAVSLSIHDIKDLHAT